MSAPFFISQFRTELKKLSADLELTTEAWPALIRFRNSTDTWNLYDLALWVAVGSL